jgi:hypothetical protein
VPSTLNNEARAWAGKVGRRLPEPAARRLRPLYARLVGPGAAPAPASAPSIVIPPRRPLGPRPEFVAAPALRHMPFCVWPLPPPPGYLGQLDDAFQREMAARWQDIELADCYFYHRVQLKDGRIVEGTWNLIGGESEYLGGVDVAGRRVLELGAASGWLTVWMEQKGATIVAFDLGWQLVQDLLPLAHIDLQELSRQAIVRVGVGQNAWWYLHRNYGLLAKAVYGTCYELPADIGRYDISVFGSILLHLRDPFRALEQAAERTDEAIVVVEPLILEVTGLGPVARWNPTRSTNPTGWWNHSPDVIVDMLSVLGFPKVTVTYHQQPYSREDIPGHHQDVAFFTVVARR